MNIRELISKHSALTAAVSAIVLGISIFFMLRTNGLSGHGSDGPPTKAFYTVDDGATLFVDDADKVPPFDHEGKPAVRAKVFTCDGGRHHWVQYLEKYVDSAALAAAGHAPPSAQRDATMAGGQLLVKRPGDAEWTPVADRDRIAEICIPKPPDEMAGKQVHVWNPK